MARTFLATYPQNTRRFPLALVCRQQGYLWPCQRVKSPESRLNVPRVFPEMFRDLRVRHLAGAVAA